jgi:hypothetical protein
MRFFLPGLGPGASFLRRVSELLPELRSPPHVVSAAAPLEVAVGGIPGRRCARAVEERTGSACAGYRVGHRCRAQSVNIGLLAGACGERAKSSLSEQISVNTSQTAILRGRKYSRRVCESVKSWEE